MGVRAALEALVQELGRRGGLDGLALDADGLVALRVDGRFTLHAVARDEDGREALLYLPLGALPADGREALFRRMLQANFGDAGTSRATLALDGESGRAVLLRRIETEAMAWPQFERAVEELLSAAETWTRELAAPEPVAATGLAEIETFKFGIRA